MDRRWFFAGIALYLTLGFIIFPFVIGIPMSLTFGSDAIGYSKGAVNLLLKGFYSYDGVNPYLDREPGMSFFLFPLYFLFGIENPVALYIAQGTLFLAAAWAFCSQLQFSTSKRIAGICFVLLLTSGSVFHAIFSAYRESLSLSLLLFFAALFLSAAHKRAWWKIILMGVLLGALILTDYPFIFFPPVLLLVWLWQRRPIKEAVIIIAVCAFMLFGWALRNASYDGQLRIIDGRRTAIMWYVRGQQAEKVQGIEPLRCLWSEYVSRDWSGRSPACSFNALMHEKWPNGFDLTSDNTELLAQSRAKILAHPVSYLWFSICEILELHIPYLGGGISHAFNLFIVLSACVLYLGFFLGLTYVFRREHALWLLLILYNTGIFILTDATPRYLVPVLFCYAVIAAVGYDALFKRQK